MTTPVTPNQRAVLRLIYLGKPLFSDVHGQRGANGRQHTLTALRRNGLIDPNTGGLTQQGREALAGDQWEPYRQAVKLRFGRVTAWRLGAAVGEAGATLPNPYPTPGHLSSLYSSGLSYGQDLHTRRSFESRND